MNVLTVYLRIYADAFRQALTGIRKNAWTLLLPIGLLEAERALTGLVIGALGRLGSFVVWIVWRPRRAATSTSWARWWRSRR